MSDLAASASGIRGLGPQADTFYLGGSPCPLFSELVPGSLRIATEYDIRRGYGLNWATVVPAGVKLAVMKFHIHIWTAAHSETWDSWSTILARPQPQAGSVALKALGFFHDAASGPPYGVQSVLVTEVAFLGQIEPGHTAHEIELLEWKQPLPAGPKPTQTTPATSNGPPQASDALGVRQNAQTAQNQSLRQQIEAAGGETADATSTSEGLEDTSGLARDAP